MRYFLLFFFTLSVFSFVTCNANAQEANAYNLNADNGLPSNHVYGMITDRNGYLWICTDKGVVRYNGYECKHFNLSNGLPNDDVWELLEDRKGRIWVGSISDRIGYLYNNKFYKVYVKEGQLHPAIYPQYMMRNSDGVAFINLLFSDVMQPSFVYFEDDTMYSDIIYDSLFKMPEVYAQKYPVQSQVYKNNNDVKRHAHALIDYSGTQIYTYEGCIYKADSGLNNSSHRPKISFSSKMHGANFTDIMGMYNFCVGNCILSYEYFKKYNYIYITNVNTGLMKKNVIDSIGSDNIQYIYIEKKLEKSNEFYIVTENFILKCSLTQDGTINTERVFKIKDFVGGNEINGNKINTVLENNFWNYCIGTTTNGVWINYLSKSTKLRNARIYFENYEFVGSHNDSLSFWWNKVESKLALVDKALNIKYYKLNNLNRVNWVTHYSGETFLICTDYPFLFDTRTGRVYGKNITGLSVFKALEDSVGRHTVITSRGLYNVNYIKDTVVKTGYDLSRYKSIIYNSLRKEYWAYNNNRIFIKSKDSAKIIGREELNSLGIISLQSICVDTSFGNVFLTGHNNIVAYNYERNTRKLLFENYSFKGDISVSVYRRTLIVVWKYGILFSHIQGNLEVSEPIVYLNTKGISYKVIYGSTVMSNTLYLNTDRGLFQIDLPTEEQLLTNNTRPYEDYKYILNYANDIHSLKNNDTIKINQVNKKLIFDVIHPNGIGSIKYYYKSKEDSAWQELNSNELNLSASFEPDNYYEIHLYTSDDSWKSKVLILNLYIQPYWWQTHAAVRLIWVGVSLLALMVLGASIYITRKFVLKAAERKHLQMEMELKSIYAQINPHFIFNSLNSALLLVSKNRVDEAYSHISKFSRLLRSYLKSSRNKYISISEEAENLKNYIELQQTRFKDKFVYEIEIDDAIQQRPVKIPSLLVQPFVENAINHGILQKKEQGRLSVRFVLLQQENKVICTIEDDGIGRKQSKINNVIIEGKTESYGDQMIKDLVSIFNRYEKLSIDITYTDKDLPLTGTIVTITIKKPNYE